MGAPFRTPSPPPISVPDHEGVRHPDAVYWTDPPPRVGLLVSAWSNQTVDGFTTPRSLGAVVFVLGLVSLFAVMLAIGAFEWFGWLGAAGVLLAFVALVALAVLESKPRPWCSYVGDAGFSEHRVGWRGEEHTLLSFDSVAGLWVSRTEHYTNGIYQHTIEEYVWRNKAGVLLVRRRVTLHERGFAAAGAKLGGGDKAVLRTSRGLMLAAATIWRERRAKQIAAEFEENQMAHFPTRGGGFFIVRAGSIETDLGGRARTITPADVVSSNLEAGVLTLKLRRGKLRLAVSDVADADIAFALAADLAGLALIQ